MAAQPDPQPVNHMKYQQHKSLPTCVLACLSLLVGVARAQDVIHKAPEQAMPFVIVGAQIHIGDGQTIESGWVLVRDGVITEVGEGDAVFTADTIQIDARGKHVYPGLISASTSLGLTEVGMVRATVDTSEVGQFTPEVRASVAVNPDSTLIPVARAGGGSDCGRIPFRRARDRSGQRDAPGRVDLGGHDGRGFDRASCELPAGASEPGLVDDALGGRTARADR